MTGRRYGDSRSSQNHLSATGFHVGAFTRGETELRKQRYHLSFHVVRKIAFSIQGKEEVENISRRGDNVAELTRKKERGR
jgi:hypothetical protein